MNQLVESFLNDYRSLGKSSGTIIQYKLAIEEFVNFINTKYFEFKEENLNQINLSHIKAFQIYLVDEKKNQAISRRKKMSALKMFFRFLQSLEKIEKDLFVHVEPIKIGRKIPIYFTFGDCEKILGKIEKRNNIRNKTIILLFLNTGMRLSELVSLNVQDIKGDSLVIKGKGNKERTVYLSEQIQDQLKKYLQVRPRIENDALFLSERGKRINKGTIQQMIKTLLDKAEIKGKTHTLRHTFATLLYQTKKADLRQLQEMMGHSNISTTTIYTQVAKKDLQKIANDNPLNNLMGDIQNENG